MDARQEGADRAMSIVRDGMELASRRFSQFPALFHTLTETKLEPSLDTPSGIDVYPPSESHPAGLVRFDPDHIIELAREHTHPKWVICARLERLILAHCDEWGCDEEERERLVAHRARYVRPGASGTKSRD